MHNPNRRKLLIAGATIGLGSFAYSYNRGFRYPRFGLEPEQPSTSERHSNAIITITDGIFLKSEQKTKLRAIAPEPSLEIEFTDADELVLSVNNIASNAVLDITGKDIKLVDEEINGITRTLTLKSRNAQTIKLDWSLPESDSFTFSVIGDSGGNDELLWGIERSHEIGAQFLLHLGDFNYHEGEYELAIDRFQNALIPVYVTIGNHDFNDSGLVYQHFLDNIGPMNNAFTLGGTRFINMDTGADFFPVNGGHRGDMFEALSKTTKGLSDQVAFTHRPFENARPAPGKNKHDHVAGGPTEVNWLKESLKRVNCDTLLAGHVHHSDEREVDGIQQWTAGEGLGSKDMSNRKPTSTFLVGQVERGKKVSYTWLPLNMPWSYHKSYYHIKHMQKKQLESHLEWFEQALAKEAKTNT